MITVFAWSYACATKLPPALLCWQPPSFTVATQQRCWKQQEGSLSHMHCHQARRGTFLRAQLLHLSHKHMYFTSLLASAVLIVTSPRPDAIFSSQSQWERLLCRAIFASWQAFTSIHIVNTHINRMPFIFKQHFLSLMASQSREWKCSDLYHLSQWRLFPPHILTSVGPL